MSADTSPSTISIANFNIHAGIDGWGTPYDVKAAIKKIDADVIVLCEAWKPDNGPSFIHDIAEEFGYKVHEFPIARARVIKWKKADQSPKSWGPYLGRPRTRQAFAAIATGPGSPSTINIPTEDGDTLTFGDWTLSVLTRVPVIDINLVELPDIWKEHSHRKAAFINVQVGDKQITVIATHLGHLLHGSVLQIRKLRKELPKDHRPAVLLGDMNCWGPPLRMMLPGWKSAIRARTWPAWRPHSQLDHIFMHGNIHVIDGAMLGNLGSDHMPVIATFSVS